MKPFHTYRDGLPPSPGFFATAGSVDGNGTPLRLGDIVRHEHIEDHTQQGVVIGIYGGTIIYMGDETNEGDEVGDFFECAASGLVIIGHAYNTLAEVARIEAAAVSKEDKNVDPASDEG